MFFLTKLVSEIRRKKIKRITQKIEKIKKEISSFDDLIVLVLAGGIDGVASGLRSQQDYLIKKLEWQEYLLRKVKKKIET